LKNQNIEKKDNSTCEIFGKLSLDNFQFIVFFHHHQQQQQQSSSTTIIIITNNHHQQQSWNLGSRIFNFHHSFEDGICDMWAFLRFL
jgi:hypothetical protein